MTDVRATTAESFTAELAARLLAFGDEECLLCYTNRMVDEFGCTGRLRFAVRWLEHHRHSRPDVVSDLRADGALCDCSLLLTVWTLREHLLEWSTVMDCPDWPTVTPPCAGAPPGHACSNWRRLTRRG